MKSLELLLAGIAVMMIHVLADTASSQKDLALLRVLDETCGGPAIDNINDVGMRVARWAHWR